MERSFQRWCKSSFIGQGDGIDIEDCPHDDIISKIVKYF